MKIQANKILIVDDSANFRKILSAFLEKIFPNVQIDQHDPVASPDLDTAINWTDYDLLLLDFNLGQEKTGLDWYQSLKTIEGFPVTIMLTGEGNEKLAVKAIKDGVDDYISKENLTKTKLTETIYEASQIHYEKLEKNLSFTQQGKAFNTELFYNTLQSNMKSTNTDSRVIIIKCASLSEIEDKNGVIFRDNLNRYISKNVFYYLLQMNLETKIICLHDKYIAILVSNDSQGISYLPEKICQHMEKSTFTSGDTNCDFFIQLGVVPLTLANLSAGQLLQTALDVCESVEAGENAYAIYDEHDKTQEIEYAAPSSATETVDTGKSGFNVVTAIHENRLQPVYQPLIAVADVPVMNNRNTYDVRSRLISSSGIQLPDEEFMQLINIAEHSQLIDKWLLRNSIGSLLQNFDNGTDGLIFCMKLSYESVTDPAFLGWLMKLLKKESIPGHSFFLDFSLEDLLKSIKKYSVLMTYLRKTYGFAFILSGLNHPDDYDDVVDACHFDFFRMNKEFTESLDEPGQMKEKWQAAITRIHDSGSHVIASFIEDGVTLSNAITVGVDIVQGYMLGEPGPDFSQLDGIDLAG